MFEVKTVKEIVESDEPQKRGEARIIVDANLVPVGGEALNDIWWQGRQWAVTSYGIEARNGKYVIEKSRLAEEIETWGWLQHMNDKDWVDIDDFATAWLVAMTLHGRGAGRYEAIAPALEMLRPVK